LWYAISCDNEAWKSAFTKEFGNKKIALKKGKRKQLQNQSKLTYRERYILEYHKIEQRKQAADNNYLVLPNRKPRPRTAVIGPVTYSALITRALEQHAVDLETRRKKRHNPNPRPKGR
jgi:hypothetical protein